MGKLGFILDPKGSRLLYICKRCGFIRREWALPFTERVELDDVYRHHQLYYFIPNAEGHIPHIAESMDADEILFGGRYRTLCGEDVKPGYFWLSAHAPLVVCETCGIRANNKNNN